MIGHGQKFLSVLILSALIVGCSGFKGQSRPDSVPEIYPGYLAGYLKPEMLPSSLKLIPLPPADGSAALAFDKEVNRENIALQGTPRWNLAAKDAELMFPKAAETFACALGVPVTEQEMPHLYQLLRRTLMDAALSTYPAKKMYQRQRPFTVNGEPTCRPDDEKFLRKDGSYPSGHAAIGWAWGLILCEIAPNRADAILTRGWMFGESRSICNVHWHSDVVEGRLMGAAVVARLHAEPVFQADLVASKAEYAAISAKDNQLMCDGQTEADAKFYH
jgi:acid phosphatase (class A)